MSSFILRNESTASIASMLDRVANSARWSGSIRYGIYCGDELYALLKQEWESLAGRPCVDLDAQKIYEVLRCMNAKAVCERYGRWDIPGPEPMPVGDWCRTVEYRPWQMLKTLECYLYQCAEGSVFKSEFYQLLNTVKNQYMKYLVSHVTEYDSAVWG
jgi:hypothetical protein